MAENLLQRLAGTISSARNSTRRRARRRASACLQISLAGSGNAMKLYPAIDLRDGVCVRLLRGEMDTATSFNDDPADQARRFAAMGFEALHVVDLNGAFDGMSVNQNAVARILDATRTPVQLGGGIRDMASVERWLEAGVSRVILGTAAVRDPQLVKDAARAWPGQVAVGIDAREGRVAVQGWAETTDTLAVELARIFEGCGV